MSGRYGALHSWIEQSEARRVGLIVISRQSEALHAMLGREKKETKRTIGSFAGMARVVRWFLRPLGSAMSRQ